jgi:hypothetical protein
MHVMVPFLLHFAPAQVAGPCYAVPADARINDLPVPPAEARTAGANAILHKGRNTASLVPLPSQQRQPAGSGEAGPARPLPRDRPTR